MPYQNDMSTLADVVGGGVAAQQAGLQNDLANQQEAIKTNIQQATMPQEIAKAQLANNLLQAQGQNEQGIAAQNLAAGTTALQAQPSAGQAATATNLSKISSAHLEQMNNLGNIVGQIAGYMDNVPAPARPAMMQQILDQQGVQDPAIRQAVASGDPDMLRGISQNIFQASATAREANIKGGYQLGVAGIEAGSREKVAQEQADARRYVADQKAQVDRLKQNTDQALAQIVTRLGTPQEQPGDRERATFLQQQSVQLRQMQSQTTQQLLGMPVPSPDLSLIPQGGGASTPSQPGAAQVPGAMDMNAMAEELRRRGALK